MKLQLPSALETNTLSPEFRYKPLNAAVVPPASCVRYASCVAGVCI